MPKTSAKTAQKPATVKALAKGDHGIFLVDGSSYIFRAHHAAAAEPQIRRVAGQCRARLLQHAVEAVARHATGEPAHLAIIFDKSETTFRNKLYPDYKAHRPPAPDDLIPQFPLIREAVRAFESPLFSSKAASRPTI